VSKYTELKNRAYLAESVEFPAGKIIEIVEHIEELESLLKSALPFVSRYGGINNLPDRIMAKLEKPPTENSQ